MRGIAYAATTRNGKVQKLSDLPVHEERWSSWVFQSNRRIARRFEHGLKAEEHLHEGACFLIVLQDDDSPVPRYKLCAVCTDGQLQITPVG